MGVKLRTRKTKSGKPTYYLDIHHHGKRWSQTLTIPKHLAEVDRKMLAKVIANDTESALMMGDHGRAPKRQLNFIKYFQEFVDENKPDDRKYLNTLRHFKKLFGKTLYVSQVNNSSMQRWKDYLMKNFNGETPATMWRTTRAVINRARKDKWFSEDPAPGVSRPPVPDSNKKVVLFPEEIKKLCKTKMPDKYCCSAWLFCIYTGLGFKEVKALKWTDISLSDRKMVYHRGKNKRRVTVDLSDTAIACLPERDPDIRKVFGLLPSDVSCGRWIKKWCKDAGIQKNVTWYCGRHTFAVLLLYHGADLRTVQSLMGHKSMNQTAEYLNYVDRLKSDAVSRLPKFDL